MTFEKNWQVCLIKNAAKRLSNAAADLGSQASLIAAAGQAIGSAFRAGGKVLVAGNGGSAACAQHFAAEFTGKLALDRAPLPAIALTVDTSAMTAIANDWSFDEVFARQVQAHGKPGDVFVGMSTSGTSRNVQLAVKAAEERGLTTIVLTGELNAFGGDYAISACLRETARIQELHDLVLHSLAQIAERVVFDDLGDDASADRFPFVLAAEDLSRFREWCSFSTQGLVTTNGAFDLLHEGHLSSLRQARSHGDQLVVLVNTDESVRQAQGTYAPGVRRGPADPRARSIGSGRPRRPHAAGLPRRDPRNRSARMCTARARSTPTARCPSERPSRLRAGGSSCYHWRAGSRRLA